MISTIVIAKKVPARDKTPGGERKTHACRGASIGFTSPICQHPFCGLLFGRTSWPSLFEPSFQPFAPALVVRFTLSFGLSYVLNMPGMLLTEAQKTDLPLLEPALEALLRAADLDENLISLFRFRKILDRQLFVALDADEAAIMKTLAKAFQLDSEEFEDKLELAKISKAWWSTAKVQSDTKRKVDAVQKAHGEPVQLPQRRLGLFDATVQEEVWEAAPIQTPGPELLRSIRRETGFRRAQGRNSSSSYQRD